jgi:HK97 family phage prohead protease
MIIHKYSKLKEINPENREIIGISSTEDEDRDGEVVKQSGIDFKNFLSTNPILLANHEGHDIRSVIGKVKRIWREDNKTLFEAQFSKASELANQAYEMVKEGILNTFSIGFMAKAFDEKKPGIITESELLEISLVPIPANPNAIVVAKNLDNKFAKKTYEMWKRQGIEEPKEYTNEDVYNNLIKQLIK